MKSIDRVDKKINHEQDGARLRKRVEELQPRVGDRLNTLKSIEGISGGRVQTSGRSSHGDVGEDFGLQFMGPTDRNNKPPHPR